MDYFWWRVFSNYYLFC